MAKDPSKRDQVPIPRYFLTFGRQSGCKGIGFGCEFSVPGTCEIVGKATLVEHVNRASFQHKTHTWLMVLLSFGK